MGHKLTTRRAKALVTGGAGFLGSHVAREAESLGFTVVVVDDLSGGLRVNVPSSRKMRQGRFPPFGLKLPEFGLQGPVSAPFLAFFDARKNPFWRGGSRKMRQGRFHPFGFELPEFGRQEPGLALFLAFFDFQNL